MRDARATEAHRRARTAPVFAVDDVRYRYLDRFPALDGVTLTIEPNEAVAILGANGCGKSTLLKMLDGLVHPEGGTVCAFGTELSEQTLDDEQFSRAFRSRVGFVFQNSDAQLFSPTVRDELAFAPLQFGYPVDEIEARVADTLALLDIEALADRSPFQLSGGEKKRVAIASVLVTNPEVLLFDEPTTALDPRTQQWFLEFVLEMQAAGKTIVTATHDLASLPVLAERCVVLSEAHRVVADGPCADVLADHALLHEANLVHQHVHRHGNHIHAHPHGADHHVAAPRDRAADTASSREETA